MFNNKSCFYKKLIPRAKERLAVNGLLAVEAGFPQAEDISKIYLKAGFADIKIIKDYNSIDRVVTGLKK